MVQSKTNTNAGYWSYAENFTYSAAGAVTSMQLGNGKWKGTVFDSRLQPAQIALGLTPNATNLFTVPGIVRDVVAYADVLVQIRCCHAGDL